MRQIINSVNRYLYNREIDLNQRLSTFFIYMGIIAAFLGTGICVVAHCSIWGVLSTLTIAVGALLVASFTHIAHRDELFGPIVAVGIMFLIPTVYLTGGGRSGGVIIWFVYELFFVGLFARSGKQLFGYLVPAVALILVTFALEYLYPGLVSPLSSSTDVLISQLASVLVVSATIVITVWVQKQLTLNEHQISERREDFTLSFIMSVATIIDAKDSYTGGHSKRVAICAREIARRMGLSDEEVENVYTVGLLHDIGKIGVPDSVLNKPGALTDEEFNLIRQHPVIGGDILKGIEFIPHVQEGAMYHHERYDGKGYPTGLKGEEIPLLARIICVADSYDAMSTNRVYRQRMTDTEIIDEFIRCRGLQFDPYITDVFIAMLHEGFRVEVKESESMTTEQYLSETMERMIKAMLNVSISDTQSYSGALNLSYQQFAQLQEYIRNLSQRFGYESVLLVMRLEAADGSAVHGEDAEKAMYSLNQAITHSIRTVDICTRSGEYSYLITLLNVKLSNVSMVVDRILQSKDAQQIPKALRIRYELMDSINSEGSSSYIHREK